MQSTDEVGVEPWEVFSTADFSSLLASNFDKDTISPGEVSMLKSFSYFINVYVIVKLASCQHERYCQVPSELRMLLACMTCFPNRIFVQSSTNSGFLFPINYSHLTQSLNDLISFHHSNLLPKSTFLAGDCRFGQQYKVWLGS